MHRNLSPTDEHHPQPFDRRRSSGGAGGDPNFMSQMMKSWRKDSDDVGNGHESHSMHNLHDGHAALSSHGTADRLQQDHDDGMMSFPEIYDHFSVHCDEPVPEHDGPHRMQERRRKEEPLASSKRSRSWDEDGQEGKHEMPCSLDVLAAVSTGRGAFDKPTFKCQRCGRSFVYQKWLERHERICCGEELMSRRDNLSRGGRGRGGRGRGRGFRRSYERDRARNSYGMSEASSSNRFLNDYGERRYRD